MDAGRTWLRFGMAAGCAVVSLWFCWRITVDTGIAEEHGTMENLQAVCLLAGALTLWLEARRRSAAARRALILAGLGYFTMLLLEFDVRPFEIPWLTRLFGGPLRNAWLGAVWLYFLTGAAKQWRHILDQGLAWLRSIAGILLCLAGVLWMAGAAIEDVQSLLRGGNHFAEELMETNAVLLMLWAAVEISIGPRRQRNAPKDSDGTSARFGIKAKQGAEVTD
jgi:hypothetical protein